MAAENDDPGIRQFLPYNSGQFKTIHKWHFNISQKNIRSFFQNLRQGNLSVRGITQKQNVVGLPRNIIPNTFPGDPLIFNKKQ